jgi:hypothetical protein
MLMEPGRMAVANANHALSGSRQPAKTLLIQAKSIAYQKQARSCKMPLRPIH